MLNRVCIAVAVVGGTCGAAGLAAGAVVTFDNGLEGWQGPQGPGGSSFIDAQDGNPANSYRTVFNNFGIDFSNSTNPAFVGDYTAAPSVTLALDVKARQVEFFFQPVSRTMIVELRSFTLAQGTPYPWVSVWYPLGDLQGGLDWTTWSVTIGDTSSATLPSGWGGYGDEDPNTFEPRLPVGITFADVLANVEEVSFSTYVPGFFFGFTDFDVSVDNISITAVPAPGTAGVMMLGGVAALRRRR
ncbi:MAG: PEP-CTERM sorting domain-containing protein [Planctomycetes bacterium]|nr:PEP-CTERM sorting domain-containing protein [Planctomycetota bacterium]